MADNNSNNSKAGSDIATLIISGFTARDPEIRSYTKDGETKKSATVTVMSNTRRGILATRAALFGKQAEFAEKYIKKGVKLIIQGTLVDDNYTDKDGVKHYEKSLLVDMISFAERKGDGSGASAGGQGNSQSEFTMIDDDDDLPFA